MELVVLGSGTSVPHPNRASAAFWLQTSAGSVLLDCSADAMHRMAQEKLDWPGLDAIWISHLHLDHCGGLAPLLFGLKHAPQTQTRRKALKIFTCDGVRKLLTAIDDTNNYGLLRQPFPIDLLEVSELANAGEAFEILPRLSAKIFCTPHTSESTAIRISDDMGASVVYTSDTGYVEELAAFAHDADLLILECSFPADKPVKTHLELSEAMELVRLAQARSVMLTHLYPQWDGMDLESKAKTFWSGKTVAAYDGLRLKVRAGGAQLK